jgi:hypothetical protein
MKTNILLGLFSMSNKRQIPKEDKSAKIYKTIVIVENLIFPINVPNGILNKSTGKNIQK